MLHQIPPEILNHIALHLTLQTNPPSPPLQLLLTSKHIYQTLTPRENPNFYARLYRSSFDVLAVERRFGGQSAVALRWELERRLRCLSRLKGLVRRGDVTSVREEDLWVIYLMLLENDGKNIVHLLNPSGFFLPTFLELYQSQCLLPEAIRPGYPDETSQKSLAMWISWLFMSYTITQPEPQDLKDERMFLLRPYVFASQKYEMYFGPWTYPDLPLLHATPRNRPTHNQDVRNPFVADLTPKSRLVSIDYYGRKLEISPPMLSLAAILLFFVRPSVRDGLPNGYGNGNGNSNGGVPASPFDLLQARIGNVNLTNFPSNGIQPPPHYVGVDDHDSDIESDTESDTESVSPSHLMSITSSTTHDRDFNRLITCYNPLQSPGLSTSTWKGSFSGCWEGTFSFFDFDAFREMLAGHSQALYTGPYGEQAQVWKVTETFVRRKRAVSPSGSKSGMSSNSSSTRNDWNMEDESNPRDRPGNENKDMDVDVEPTPVPPRGLPLNGPSTNAGFPTDLPSSTSAGLGSAEAEAHTLRETIKQQVEAIEGYEIVPDDELEGMLADHPRSGGARYGEDGDTENEGVEMLLTGTGHSAWGRFILKGRVRVWDGMATLVKEYAPDARGKWIYRGYVLSGGVFVGRWRDTFTPDAYVGYEGTFILNRRQ